MSLESFTLNHPGSCSGMFWRDAPPNTGLAHSLSGTKPDWPRNGAVLQGHVHKLDAPVGGNYRWLEVTGVKPGGHEAAFAATPNCWMPFEQNGLVLHRFKN